MTWHLVLSYQFQLAKRRCFEVEISCLAKPARIEVYIAFAERVNKKASYMERARIRVEVSISIYLFSRIVRTTTVSILHGVFFLSSLPHFPSPPPLPLFFVFLPLRFNFSLLLCASTLPFPSPCPPTPAPFLFFPFPCSSLHPLAPFVPLLLYDSSQLLPFLFSSFPSLLLLSRLSYPVFRFLFSFLCPLLSLFHPLALSWPEPDLRMLKPQGN